MKYLEPTQELLIKIGKDEQVTKEFAFAHPVELSNSDRFYCAMLYPDRYKVNESLREEAKKWYEKMKQDKVKQVKKPNLLTFVGMGMNYEPRYEGDLGNHRIRTEIVNSKGRRFFIEVGTGRGTTMRIDHVIDRDEQDYYEAELTRYSKLMQEGGGFIKHGNGSYLYEQVQKYQKQPYYWYKKDDWYSLNVEYTKENVLKLVNKLFDCNFIEIQIDYYLLTTEDYKSISL